MALAPSAGIQRTGPNYPTKPKPAPVQPMPVPPGLGSLFGGGAAAKPAKGAFTQKNGKWFDSAGNELTQGAGGFSLKNQPQQGGGFNFNFGGTAGGSLGGGTGGGAAAGGTLGGPGGQGGSFTNFAQTDPNIQKATDAMYSRYQNQVGQEGQVDPFQMESINNLRKQQSSDQTHRATDRATSSIRDFGAGQQQAAAERRAQMGQGGGSGNAISESAQRAQAKAAADIQMNEQGRQDQLALGGANILNAPGQMNLARQGQNNALLGQLYGGADMGSRNALGQQTLGLESWKAQNDPKYDRNFQQALMSQQLQQGQLGLAGQMLGLQGSQMDLYGNYLKALQGAGYGGY